MVLLTKGHFHINHSLNAGVKDYLANMTMFQYYLRVRDLDVPYWTMIIEMLFYLLILVLFELKWLRHITIIGCLINVVIIANYWLVSNHVIQNYTGYFPLLNHFALFFGGITFYKIANRLQSKAAGYLTIFFCLITQITIFRFAGSDPDHITFYQYVIMLVLYVLTFALFINGRLRFIVLKPLVFLGKISFALYLIHSFIFRGVIGFLQKHSHLNFWVITLLITVPLAILLATLITDYIEKPLGKKLKALLLRRSQPVMAG